MFSKIDYRFNCFYDVNDPLVPENWAREALWQLYANTVLLNLVHREYSSEISEYGDVVNTHRPSTFTAKRKTDSDNVTKQTASSTKVAVKLNQHIHTSFALKPKALSTSFVDLVTLYLKPAMESVVKAVEQAIASQIYQFIGYSYGKIGTAASKTGVIGCRTVLSRQNCPDVGRFLLVTPNSEGSLLDTVELTAADRIGDDGTALRQGSLGRKYNFDIVMSQNLPSISSGQNDTLTRAVNLSGGYAAGATSIVTDGSGGTPVAGSWLTIAGDMTPQFITGYSSTSGTFTISPGLKYAVANDAVVTIYEPAKINLSGGYAADWNAEMVVDDLTNAPVIGQMLSTGVTVSTRNIYGCLPEPNGAPTSTSIYLDRPLEAAVANDAIVGIGPYGEYNFAGHRNAIGFISRPLAQPDNRTGVMSSVVEYNGLGLRVCINWDGDTQGYLVTIDVLAGVKVFDTRMGVIYYA